MDFIEQETIILDSNNYDENSFLQLESVQEADVVLKLFNSMPSLLVLNYLSQTSQIEDTTIREESYGIFNKYTGKVLISGVKTIKTNAKSTNSMWKMYVDKNDYAQALMRMLNIKYKNASILTSKEGRDIGSEKERHTTWLESEMQAFKKYIHDSNSISKEELKELSCRYNLDKFKSTSEAQTSLVIREFNDLNSFDNLESKFTNLNCSFIPVMNDETKLTDEVKYFTEEFNVFDPTGNLLIADIIRITESEVCETNDISLRKGTVKETVFVHIPKYNNDAKYFVNSFLSMIVMSGILKKYTVIFR